MHRCHESLRGLSCWIAIALAAAAPSAGQDLSPPHPKTNPKSALMLRLPDSGTDPLAIDLDELPRVPAERAVIKDVRDRGGRWVNQHAYLARFGGRYWAMWSDGPGVPRPGVSPEEHRNVVPGHDQAGTRVSFATSEDGVDWSEPGDLSGPPRIEGFGWIARGYWVRDGELLALATHFNAPGYPGPGLSLEAFRWDESSDKWVAHGTVLDDSMNNFPPKRLPNGLWMMTRRDHQRQVSVMIGGMEGFDQWQVHPMAAYDGAGRPEELRVEELMSRSVEGFMSRDALTVPPRAPLTRVLQKMLDARVKSFPVLDGNELVGVVAREDLLQGLRRAVAGEKPEAG